MIYLQKTNKQTYKKIKEEEERINLKIEDV